VISITLAESQESPVALEALQQVLEVFLDRLFEGERGVALHLTDDPEMQQLNGQFRNKEATTDVLSWSYFEEEPDVEHVGDLAVSLDRVRAQAEENGWDEQTELYRLLAHGCAHLAGWDHERSEGEAREMLEVEMELLNAVGLPGLYPE
jgi:probable rRNA maturation factor